ncbi:hypothetical protein PIB30_115584, partial [Stylosanthes scabra]|nr:hypothetical protein [Stylosanthes scabra]
MEFPKELSTWVCAAKCMIVSISSSIKRWFTMSELAMSPLMNLNFGDEVHDCRFLEVE